MMMLKVVVTSARVTKVICFQTINTRALLSVVSWCCRQYKLTINLCGHTCVSLVLPQIFLKLKSALVYDARWFWFQCGFITDRIQGRSTMKVCCVFRLKLGKLYDVIWGQLLSNDHSCWQWAVAWPSYSVAECVYYSWMINKAEPASILVIIKCTVYVGTKVECHYTDMS